jgi:chromosomal replication initiator protein
MNNHEAVWNATAQLLKAQVSEGVWYSTFNDVVALTSDDESLRLQVPNAHVRDRIVTRYRPLVIDALDEIGESDRELIIEISDNPCKSQWWQGFSSRPQPALHL